MLGHIGNGIFELAGNTECLFSYHITVHCLLLEGDLHVNICQKKVNVSISLAKFCNVFFSLKRAMNYPMS